MQNQQLGKRFVSFSKYSSLIITIIGLFATGGWLLNIPAFMSVLPGLPTIKINTALAFLLAGIALWIASQENPQPFALRMAQICRVTVFLIGLLTLSEYIFGWNAGIDQLIFKDLQAQQEAFPGRMAFATALCFTLMGAASMSIHAGVENILKIGQYLIVAVLSISLLAVVGYVYDVQALYKLSPYSSMALLTATGMVLLALGTLSLQADRGWIRIISTETAGGLVLRRLIPVVLSIPIIVGWLIVLGDQAGFYEANFGLAMISVLTAGFLIITLWQAGRQLNRIDEDRKQAEEQIAYQANLLANVSDAIVASDAQFRLTAWNAAAEDMYGWRADEVLGRMGVEILQTEFPDMDAQEMPRKIVEAGKWQVEAIQLHKDGRRIAVELSSIVLRDAMGEVSGYLSVNRDITERKRIEDEIRTLNIELEQRVAERTAELSVSEARFRGLFEHAPVSIWEEDFSAVRQYLDNLRRTGVEDFSAYFDAHPEALAESAALVKIVDVNHATLEMYQAESKSQLLADLSKVLGPESLIPFKEELLTLVRGETSFENETINYTLRGERRVIFLRLTVAPGYEQTWAKVFVGIGDITERRQAEHALREAEIKYRTLVEQLPAIVYLDQYDPTVSAGYRPVYISPQVKTILGYHPDEFIADPDLWPSLLHPDDRERALTVDARHYGAGELLRQEYHVIARDGRVVWLRDEAVMIRDEVNRKTFSQGVLLDITAHKQAEEALHQSEERFRLMAWATKDAVWDWDLRTNQIWWGAGLQKIFHFATETIQTDLEWWLNHIHPDDRAKVDRTINAAIEGGMEFWSKEYRFQRVDETFADIMDRGYIIRNEAGEAYRMIGAMMDITDRKQTEQALLASEARYRQIVETAGDIIYRVNLRGHLTYVNPTALRIMGYKSEEEVLDRQYLEFVHPAWRERVRYAYNRQFVEKTLNTYQEFLALTRARREIWLGQTVQVVMENNRVTGFQAVARDITAQKEAEAALKEANGKMGQVLTELQQRNQESALLNEMSHLLQACQTAEEAFGIIVDLANQLFPHTAGALYLLNATRTQVSTIATWGDLPSTRQMFALDDCRALRRGPTRPLNEDQRGSCCLHSAQPPAITYCLPIHVQGEVVGIFHLQSTSEENLLENKRQLAYTVIEQSELALSNLRLREALREQSIRDPLTRLYNRRYMEEALKQQLSRVTRQLHPLGLIMIDIDHFKNFNDAYGHAAGDALLRELGKLLQSHIRGGDVACRYGGEEFLLIMPDASLEAAHQRAKQLQLEAKKLRVQDAGQSFDGVTLSLGVAIYPEHGRNIDSVLRAADTALYRAKQEGRDRVVVAERAY